MNDANVELQRATVAAAKMIADATAKSQMTTMAFRDAAYAAYSGDADRERRASRTTISNKAPRLLN
jgi:hypothetical protein